MDRFDAMRLFTRVVERRSFTQAASDIGLPRSTVTQVINQLEERLGVRLLQRTTRVVRPTLDGEAYYRRCLAIIQDMEDAEGAFCRQPSRKALLRIDVQGTLARHFLMPNLPAFLAQYPDIEISMSESDRWVDLVHEGVDCALRWGELADSGLVARRLAVLTRITCAAPAYLKRFGRPRSLADLGGHRMVGLRRFTSGDLEPLNFIIDGKMHGTSLAAPFSVTGPESYLLATRLGFGIAQMPQFHIAEDLRRGSLVALLPNMPPPPAPVSLMYAQNRQLAPRVRAFSDWLAQQFRESGN